MTKLDILKDALETAQYNKMCYEKEWEEKPKPGYEKEWEMEVEKAELIEELINDLQGKDQEIKITQLSKLVGKPVVCRNQDKEWWAVIETVQYDRYNVAVRFTDGGRFVYESDEEHTDIFLRSEAGWIV